jgi:multiple sugar transport system permease protein
MSLQASEGSQLGVLRERFRDLGDDYLPVWFMLPVVATLLTFTIFPFVYNVYLMFVEYDLSDPTSLGEFAGLSNLVSAFIR